MRATLNLHSSVRQNYQGVAVSGGEQAGAMDRRVSVNNLSLTIRIRTQSPITKGQ